MNYIEQKKVSIIIPVYNVEKYLSECIESAINQSHTNKEIIVINDGSTDGSGEIIEQYEKKHKELIYIKTENKGQSAARNTGLKKASGDYIIFLDSDDWLEKDTLKLCLNVLHEKNADIVLFNAISFSDGVEEIEVKKFNYTRPDYLNNRSIGCFDIFSEFVKSNNYIVSPCLYLYRHEKFRSIKFYPGITHEDNLFTTQLLLANSNNIATCIPNRLFHRRVRPGSTMTEEKSMKHVTGYLKVAEELSNDRAVRRTVKTEDALNLFIQSTIKNCINTAKIAFNKKIPFSIRIKLIKLLLKTNNNASRNKDILKLIIPDAIINRKV